MKHDKSSLNKKYRLLKVRYTTLKRLFSKIFQNLNNLVSYLLLRYTLTQSTASKATKPKSKKKTKDC